MSTGKLSRRVRAFHSRIVRTRHRRDPWHGRFRERSGRGKRLHHEARRIGPAENSAAIGKDLERLAQLFARRQVDRLRRVPRNVRRRADAHLRRQRRRSAGRAARSRPRKLSRLETRWAVAGFRREVEQSRRTQTRRMDDERRRHAAPLFLRRRASATGSPTVAPSPSLARTKASQPCFCTRPSCTSNCSSKNTIAS